MPSVATWMDLESFILSEVSQTEKEKYHMASLICEIWKEMIQMNLLTKQNKTHRLRKQMYGCHKGKGIVREFGVVMYTLLYLKWITNKDILYGTRNSAQHYMDGRGIWGRVDTCTCMPESLHCSPETITTCSSAVPQDKIKSSKEK